jgi:hypothetical protein
MIKERIKEWRTQLSEVIAAFEVIEVKGVNDDTQSMKIRNEELGMRNWISKP